MAAHAHRSSGTGSFLLGVIVTIVVLAGILLWVNAAPNREPALRTVELAVPTPEIPLPPGTVPDSGKARPS